MQRKHYGSAFASSQWYEVQRGPKCISNISQCTHIYLPYRWMPFRPLRTSLQYHSKIMERVCSLFPFVYVCECSCKCELPFANIEYKCDCGMCPPDFTDFRMNTQTCISKWNISMGKLYYLSPYFRVSFPLSVIFSPVHYRACRSGFVYKHIELTGRWNALYSMQRNKVKHWKSTITQNNNTNKYTINKVVKRNATVSQSYSCCCFCWCCPCVTICTRSTQQSRDHWIL